MESPCINECWARYGVCTGCGRTLLEIRSWAHFTPERRAEIMARLKKNKPLLQEDEPR